MSNPEKKCESCGGDGIETCDNPDHGLIDALSFHDVGRLGCPCCGHDPKHKVGKRGNKNKCPDCNGTGLQPSPNPVKFQVQAVEPSVEEIAEKILDKHDIGFLTEIRPRNKSGEILFKMAEIFKIIRKDFAEALKATILKLNQDGLQLANVFKTRIKELENELQAERTKRLEAEKVYIYQGSDYEAELLNKQHQQIKELEAKLTESENALIAEKDKKNYLATVYLESEILLNKKIEKLEAEATAWASKFGEVRREKEALESKLKTARLDAEFCETAHEKIAELEAKVKELSKYPFGCDNQEHMLDTINLLESQLATATSERDRARALLNAAVFRPKHPLDAMSYNELQEALAAANAKIVELEKECDRLSSIGMNRIGILENDLMNKTIESNKQIATEKAKAEKLVEALEATECLTYNSSCFEVNDERGNVVFCKRCQALKEFRGGE